MANRNFYHTDPGKPDPIYFEQIFAEKPGGGLVAAPEFDIKPTTAVSAGSDGKFLPIKAYRLVEAVTADATTIKIAKGSGVQKGDVIAHGTKGVACTAVDTTTSEDYDVVTVTLGVAITADTVLYQAAAASASAAAPIYSPAFVLGNTVWSGNGDQEVRLVNGANLRKETACIAAEVAALLKSIQLV
jgi:hypothetical protein